MRRAKLYYLRERIGKAAKIKEKREPELGRRTELSPLSADDLENFEAERELQLAQEYQDVAAMFRFAVETERRVLPGQRGRGRGSSARRRGR